MSTYFITIFPHENHPNISSNEVIKFINTLSQWLQYSESSGMSWKNCTVLLRMQGFAMVTGVWISFDIFLVSDDHNGQLPNILFAVWVVIKLWTLENSLQASAVKCIRQNDQGRNRLFWRQVLPISTTLQAERAKRRGIDQKTRLSVDLLHLPSWDDNQYQRLSIWTSMTENFL